MKAFQPAHLLDVLRKFHYPFQRVEVRSAYTNVRDDHPDIVSTNLTFLLLHGLFMLCWYSLVLGCYIYYFGGYCVYWMIAVLIEQIKASKSNQ